ncbi:glucose dehydrogenase [FAD, quinone]-like [Argiope bruennichi]|uniref:Glucose dehydrogenase like protein n=1 Tax=Argiope bruennichi TaxID=94029 RepID=A0A8T0EXL8_ARGBR|nr:glucose dehydrogenase [FAD, quinone]-like [Argiope bruennichi]KAF8782850.1 Glucose dehydrogenase like protein [Argiope bruennichi]
MLFDLIREYNYPTPYAASPLLPFILLAMAGQKHSPKTTTNIKEEYDYIVVGSGSAGSVVASRLSERNCVSILLLEAGKSPPRLSDLPVINHYLIKTDLDWNFYTTPQVYAGRGLINQTLSLSAGKAIGGTSIINGLQSARGNRKDYNDWAAQGAIGWSYEEVLPYFKKLENNTDPEFVKNGYHGTDGPVTMSKPMYDSELKFAVIEAAKQMGYDFLDSNGPKQKGFYDLQATIRNGQRCSAAKAYLVPNDYKENLDIVENAFVKKVIIEDGQARGVEFDFTGSSWKVMARKEVILSAGTINSAKLLMLSGIGPKEELQKHNISVVADLPVGRNLQEHFGSMLNFELSDKIEPFSQKLRKESNILEYLNLKTGILTSVYGVTNIAFLNTLDAKDPNDLPEFELYFGEGAPEIVKYKLMISKQYHKAIYGPYVDKPFYWCLAQVLHPKSRGYVTLRSNDPYDPPIVNPNYFSHPYDLDIIVAGMKKCKEIGTSDPLVKIGSKLFSSIFPGCEDFVGDDDKYFRCMAKSILITSSHPVGTVKMGDPKDPSTVLDPRLRVKSIRNLRVVDASVMPKSPSGNTHVPTMMIGEKASDMIKESIHCDSDNKLRI